MIRQLAACLGCYAETAAQYAELIKEQVALTRKIEEFDIGDIRFLASEADTLDAAVIALRRWDVILNRKGGPTSADVEGAVWTLEWRLVSDAGQRRRTQCNIHGLPARGENRNRASAAAEVLWPALFQIWSQHQSWQTFTRPLFHFVALVHSSFDLPVPKWETVRSAFKVWLPRRKRLVAYLNQL